VKLSTAARIAARATRCNLPAPQLRRQLGFFDATMIVMGGIVGSGIFINPCRAAGAYTAGDFWGSG
jgi:amino acid transporter